MLGTNFWYFMLDFLARPKHSEQAGGLGVEAQLLFANREQHQHFLSRQVNREPKFLRQEELMSLCPCGVLF